MSLQPRFALERVSQPELEPITLAEMKLHLRCYASITTEDASITALIVAAREWVEDYTGRVLVDQTWRLTIGDEVDARFGADAVVGNGCSCGVLPAYWSSSGIPLRKAPVLGLVSIVSVDSAGTETALDVNDYRLLEPQSKWPRIVALAGSTWSGGTLRVAFRAGFADRTGSPQQGAEMVPERFKWAMKLWTEAVYDRDEKLMPILLKTAEDIIRGERAELQMA